MIRNLACTGRWTLEGAETSQTSGPSAPVTPDPVNHPSHYTDGAIECIDAIKASMEPDAFRGYLKGAAIKYLWRYEKKANPLEDLKKAQWYVNRLIEESRA